jgi:hypothetical protein
MAERFLSSLIRGGKTFRSGRDLLDCHRTFRSNCFPWRGNEAEKTRLYRGTGSHLCGSGSSAIAANNAYAYRSISRSIRTSTARSVRSSSQSIRSSAKGRVFCFAL